MKYKATLFVCAGIVAVLALSFFFSEEVAVSELEIRNMATFGIILNPVDEVDPDTGVQSVLYNADKSIPDRLEDALKDQIFLREAVVLNYSNLESRLANLYADVAEALTAPFKKKPPIKDKETDAATETQSGRVYH